LLNAGKQNRAGEDFPSGIRSPFELDVESLPASCYARLPGLQLPELLVQLGDSLIDVPYVSHVGLSLLSRSTSMSRAKAERAPHIWPITQHLWRRPKERLA
jgi:hypothetical protein